MKHAFQQEHAALILMFPTQYSQAEASKPRPTPDSSNLRCRTGSLLLMHYSPPCVHEMFTSCALQGWFEQTHLIDHAPDTVGLGSDMIRGDMVHQLTACSLQGNVDVVTGSIKR